MSPRDFLDDNQPSINSSSVGMGSPRDFLAEHEEQPESFGTSAKLALPRIYEDASKLLYGTVKSIPGYFQKAKTEIPAVLNPYSEMNRNPFHAAGQKFAGLNELINSLAQLPLDISKYGSERLHLLPKGFTNALQKITPEDTTQAINQLFGEPKYPGEAALRGLVRNTPTLGIVSKLNPASLLTSKKSLKNTILNKHDALENRAISAFDKVSEEVNNRGINKIPMESNFDSESGIKSSDEFFENMKQYFPDTRSSKKLIDNAKKGEFNALRKLQTDLYQRGKTNLGSSLEADRMKGAEMFEKRNDINQMISNHLKNTENHDLDNLLNQARQDWSTLQKTYYHPKMNNAIVNMVDTQIRRIPKNLPEILQEESIPMKNLIDFHPGLSKKIKGHKKGQKILKKGLKYGVPAGAAFVGYEYGKPKR